MDYHPFVSITAIGIPETSYDWAERKAARVFSISSAKSLSRSFSPAARKALAADTNMFLAAGVGLLFCSDSMFILGCTLIAFAVILFLAMKSSYVIEGKEGSFRRKTANYPKTKKEELVSFLEGKSDKVVPEAPGGLLMYIYYRRDKSAGFAQINDFDQYEYKPITEMLPLNAGQVKALV